MSTEGIAGDATGPGQGPGNPSEEELRAAYEAELSRISTTDMMAQAAVSLLNLGARRLAPADGDEAGQRDLEQARDAIDGVKALLEILERRISQELGPLRDALSRLQMAYTREVKPGAPGAGQPQGAGAPGEPAPPAEPAQGEPGAAQSSESQSGPGPAETSGRLWVPGR